MNYESKLNEIVNYYVVEGLEIKRKSARSPGFNYFRTFEEAKKRAVADAYMELKLNASRLKELERMTAKDVK